MIFVEGDHDIAFFTENIVRKTGNKPIITKKPFIYERLRSFKSGVLLIGCGGCEELLKIVPPIMRQFTVYEPDKRGFKSFLIADSDKTSLRKVVSHFEEEIITPARNPNGHLTLSTQGSDVIVENSRTGWSTRTQVQLVPTSLEVQVINKLKEKFGYERTDGLTEDEELEKAASELGLGDISRILKTAAEWFVSVPWKAEIDSKLTEN